MFVFPFVLFATVSVVFKSTEAQVHSAGLLSSKPVDCGVSLAGLTSKCANVRHSVPLYCCRTLQVWNDNFCWCNKNAFRAASNLAMDVFAFQFRVNSCNVTSPLRPEITLPIASKNTIPSTCEKRSAAQGGLSLSKTYENAKYKSIIYQSRMEVLQRLSQLNVLRKADVSDWSNGVDAIFAPDAILFSIGFSFSFPRVNVKKTLLTRTTLFGGVPWGSTIDPKSVEWGSFDTVSYLSRSSYGFYSFERVEFVSFEKGSSRIIQLVAQEEEAVRLFKQFVYFEPSDRILWRTRRSSVSWCRNIFQTCGLDMFPYPGMKSCVKAYKNLQSSRASCAAQGPRTSLIALHGDTPSCRNIYMTLAKLNPEQYCPFLGSKGFGLCRRTGCPDSWYNNIFETSNPRFDSSLMYRCSSKNCWEDWPAQGGEVEESDFD